MKQECGSRTFGSVGGLVGAPVAEDFVLNPWHPRFVLLVVPELAGLVVAGLLVFWLLVGHCDGCRMLWGYGATGGCMYSSGSANNEQIRWVG